MDMSFYGGKQGKSFRIAKVFQNKAEMIEDLKAGWYSDIGMNELIFINYGNPSDKTIYSKANVDITIDNQTFTPTTDLTRWETNRFIDTNYQMSLWNEETQTYETKADGKLYNTTIWQKCYKDDYITKDGAPVAIPVKTDGKTDTVNGMDKYIISDDYGIGYYLIASLTGNTPIIDAASSWIATDKLPSVSVKYDENDLEHPILYFELPKGVSFLYGTEITAKTVTSATITENLERFELFGTGDYYINSKNGNVYLCTSISKTSNEIKLGVTFVASLARQLDEIITNTLPSYTKINGEWKSTPITGTSEITDELWKITLGIPSVPKIEVNKTDFVGAEDLTLAKVTSVIQPNATNENVSNTYNLDFILPKASTWYSGTGLPLEESLEDIKNGDYYLQTTTYDLYKFTNNTYDKIGNIQGAVGPTAAINIVDRFSYTYKDSNTTKTGDRTYEGNLDIETTESWVQFGDLAEAQVGYSLTSSDMIAVVYTDSNENINSYWLFKTAESSWATIRVSGNSAALANNVVTINESINNKGGQFSKIDIGQTIDSTTQIDFQVTKDDDTLFDEVFSNMQQQISEFSQSIENFKSAVIDIEHGGTGATTVEGARANLGIYSKEELDTQIQDVVDKSASPTLNFTIPLQSSGTGTWATVDNKIQVVLSIANNFTANKEPIIILKKGNQEDYNNIESISFDSESIVILLKAENSQEIQLFAFYPQ